MSSPATLLACLTQENTLITQYTALLEAETQVLVDRAAFEQLPGLTQKKDTLARQLAALSDQRDTLLAAMGLPIGHEGTQQAAARHPELAKRWQALLANAATARECNARNSALLEVSLRYTQQSLDALRDIGGLGASGTYDAQGRGTRPGYASKNIVTA